MKRSEYISQFLNFIEQCKTDSHESIDGISREEKRQEDLLHDIENCRNAKERSKLATQLHRCREMRRELKNTQEQTSWIVNFVAAPENKKTFDRMTQVLGNVRRTEERHENWVYNPRLKEDE